MIMLLKKYFIGIFLCTLIFLQACAPTLPKARKKSLKLPESFPSMSEDPKKKEAPKDLVSPNMTWKDFFRDSELSDLIEVALKNNQELKILEQEIQIANNEVMARQGEYLPRLGFEGDYGIEKTERFSTEDANGPVRFGRAGLVTSWEVDIWKRLRNSTKAAYYEYLSSIEGRKFMVTNLVSETAKTYYELMALDNQLEIVETYIGILEKVKVLVEHQQRAAKVTSLAVKRYEAEVLKNQSRRYELRQRIAITENKLNVLVGRFPRKVKRDSDEFLELAITRTNASVPAKLLNNRPDIKEASLKLKAAKLDVKAAKARFYPALSIEGSAGYENFNSKHFNNSPTDAFYNLAANISAPLLNRQAIKADYFSANNEQIKAIYNYERTLLNAYSEVANQLTMIKNLDEIYELKSKEVEVLTDSIEIANILFRSARIDYIEALLTQREALSAQVELVEIKKEQLSAYIDLYKSLGGGWRDPTAKVKTKN